MSDTILDTARTILAFVRWVDGMPPAPGRHGDEAMAETAQSCVQNALDACPRLDEMLEELDADTWDAEAWAAIVAKLEAEQPR